MLEGLEAVEVRWNVINDELRYEAEFFKKRFLQEDTALSRWPTQGIGEFAHVTDGPHGYHVVDQASPIVMLTAKNAKNWFSERIGADPIATWVDAANKRSSLEENDIILSTRGTVGLCALVTKESLPANIDQDVARISWPDKKTFIPGFIVAYLNSSYGQDHITRYASGMVQQGLSLQKVREIPIPLLSPSFQKDIANTITTALDLRRKAGSLLQRTEAFLLKALGMTDFLPSAKAINIKSFKDSFAATGRLDAEGYQPKYDQLRSVLDAYPSGVTTIDELAHQITNGAEVREYQEKGITYLRVGDLKNLTIDPSTVVRIAPASAEQGLEKIGLQAGDVLVSRSGSLAVTAVVEPEWKDALISSHLIRLRIQDARIDPYYLALFLGSVPGKMQIQQRSNGGVQPEISQPALKSIVVPIPPTSAQQEIKRLVLSAQKLRDASNDLLEATKRAVEIAIEQDEAAGLAYLAAQNALSPGAHSSASTAEYLQ